MSQTSTAIKNYAIRKPYEVQPLRVTISSFEKTLAQQQFQDECDINTIMDRYANDGLLDHVNNFEGSYGDFTSATDYQSSLNQVIAAEGAFMDLPAKVRARFGNDPAQLIGFLESNDQDDIEESVKLGLREPAATPPPQPKAAPAASGASDDATQKSGPASPDSGK